MSSIFDVLYQPYLHRWTPYPIPELVASDISVFLPNYRGSSGCGREFRTAIRDQTGVLECEDIVSGTRAALVHTGQGDLPTGIAGWSHGGYLAALLGTRFSSIFAAVSMGAGFTSVSLQYWSGGNNMESYFRGNPESGRSLSPVDYVHPGMPPVMLQHGKHDSVVNPVHSVMFSRRLQATGVKSKLEMYNGGHVISTPCEMERVRRHNYEWFEKHLAMT
ncbi:MAG TPA: prolyl oligopeptidase family serine peptidase [Candidatus Methylacidiphilales bacterium]|nr:prolyl oligopeptidase family serine peptidase [Candidatus Methylacidiphilales bacterium]